MKRDDGGDSMREEMYAYTAWRSDSGVFLDFVFLLMQIKLVEMRSELLRW